MTTTKKLCTGLLVLGLLCLTGIAAAEENNPADTSGTVLTDDIPPYDGPIGADSPLYGLKLALEDMDESFTANETERIDKQINHARLRLSEVRRSLDLNQSESAQQALNNYWLKTNLTNTTISLWRSNATGLLHAQEMIVKHQFVLENLIASHPGNRGLLRAYNNSLQLEEKFGEKTLIRFNRTMEKNNKTILKAIRLEQKEYNRKGWPDATVTVTASEAEEQQMGQKKDKGWKNSDTVTTAATQAPAGTQTQDDRGRGKGQDDRGNGNGGNGKAKNK